MVRSGVMARSGVRQATIPSRLSNSLYTLWTFVRVRVRIRVRIRVRVGVRVRVRVRVRVWQPR